MAIALVMSRSTSLCYLLLRVFEKTFSTQHAQATKQAIKGTEDLTKQTSNEAYSNTSLAAKLTSRASSLIQEGKSLRAKLKYEREWKRKTQEDIWAMAYDTCLLEKNKRDEARRRAKS